MAIPKVCGIETEYGVDPARRGRSQSRPGVVDAHQRLRRAPQGRMGLRGRVARATTRVASHAKARCRPEIETHLVNTVLTNGARYYVDHAHPEYSTPECSDALELVCADKAGERILARSMLAARRLAEPGQEIVVYKNNSDGKGNSYGTHENYLVDRSVPFSHARAQPAAVVREPPGVHRRRQGRLRERRRRGRLPDQPARRLLRGGGRARDHAEAPDRQHAATSRTQIRRRTAGCT